ncbi:hypothetical protein L5515_009620 [Caenorhabditis briggsae]|uniref:Uncharacterized protein n=2 Tax=Caenorhabditis briggsae TaxID=6238 RepID=A0AAE9EP78_CAEBR|nr:hypothetical protein L5515_013040 [Caenorhabditis briggsae]UMM24935.1 hypothetical protein L5515_004934 [Caenorhabditis briggsae]UMM25589.1 hypothetical protein L5515_005344 [Caenorhabditis briggsae]UMM27710.1 hypothetical protein L5515_010887 [Caenorhabditis briggsae]UMM30573.1 hypothetical protein L5515_012394 [Caenorhabditis briggsae]
MADKSRNSREDRLRELTTIARRIQKMASENRQSNVTRVTGRDTMQRAVHREGMVSPFSLTEKYGFWSQLTDNEFIKSVIRDGYLIPLNGAWLPSPQGLRRSARENKQFVLTELNKLVESGVVVETVSPKVVSSLHVAVNGEKKRLILDLSQLNKSLTPPHFRLEDWKTAWPFLQRAKYAATFDFRGGYHHVRIADNSTDLLAFSLSNPHAPPYFKFVALPFGLSTAPWLFTKIFRPLVARWREFGIKIFLYLDDGLILAETKEQALLAVKIVREDLEAAGVTVAEDKSFWEPSHQFTWLGLRGDLSERTVRLTEKREKNLRAQLEKMRRSEAPTILDRQKLCGYLSSMTVISDEAIRRQRRVSHAVATTIKEHPEIDTSIGVPLSKGSRNHVQLEQMSFNGFEKPRSWDWHEGHKAAFFESLVEEAERAGLMHLVDSLGKAPIEARAVSTMKAYAGENQRRINWSKSLPASLSEEHRFTLYLVDRAMSAGSSSLAKAAAAFKLANDGLSPFASQLVSDVIKAQRRKESESRAQPTQVSVNTVSKIVDMVQDDEKSERNALVVTLSFYGLLRAEEASMLKWSDVHQSGNMLKLKIRRAKNDQLARGRETFCDWPEGSKRDCLLKRFRARASMRPGLDFVFQNILNGTKLTPSAISGIAKDTLAAAGVSATHHSLRRGRANHLQQSGVDFQAIKETGRWRSDAGLRCYLSDSPRAQGFTVTELGDEVGG